METQYGMIKVNTLCTQTLCTNPKCATFQLLVLAHRNPRLEAELSGVFMLRAEQR